MKSTALLLRMEKSLIFPGEDWRNRDWRWRPSISNKPLLTWERPREQIRALNWYGSMRCTEVLCYSKRECPKISLRLIEMRWQLEKNTFWKFPFFLKRGVSPYISFGDLRRNNLDWAGSFIFIALFLRAWTAFGTGCLPSIPRCTTPTLFSQLNLSSTSAASILLIKLVWSVADWGL